MLPGWLMNSLNTSIVQLYDLWPRSLAEWDRNTDTLNMNTCNAIIKIWMSSFFLFLVCSFVHFSSCCCFFFSLSFTLFLLSALKTSSTLLLLLSLHFCLGRVVSVDGAKPESTATLVTQVQALKYFTIHFGLSAFMCFVFIQRMDFLKRK